MAMTFGNQQPTVFFRHAAPLWVVATAVLLGCLNFTDESGVVALRIDPMNGGGLRSKDAFFEANMRDGPLSPEPQDGRPALGSFVEDVRSPFYAKYFDVEILVDGNRLWVRIPGQKWFSVPAPRDVDRIMTLKELIQRLSTGSTTFVGAFLEIFEPRIRAPKHARDLYSTLKRVYWIDSMVIERVKEVVREERTGFSRKQVETIEQKLDELEGDDIRFSELETLVKGMPKKDFPDEIKNSFLLTAKYLEDAMQLMSSVARMQSHPESATVENRPVFKEMVTLQFKKPFSLGRKVNSTRKFAKKIAKKNPCASAALGVSVGVGVGAVIAAPVVAGPAATGAVLAASGSLGVATPLITAFGFDESRGKSVIIEDMCEAAKRALANPSMGSPESVALARLSVVLAGVTALDVTARDDVLPPWMFGPVDGKWRENDVRELLKELAPHRYLPSSTDLLKDLMIVHDQAIVSGLHQVDLQHFGAGDPTAVDRWSDRVIVDTLDRAVAAGQ
jgi:hypothetical protein